MWIIIPCMALIVLLVLGLFFHFSKNIFLQVKVAEAYVVETDPRKHTLFVTSMASGKKFCIPSTSPRKLIQARRVRKGTIIDVTLRKEEYERVQADPHATAVCKSWSFI